MRYGSGVAWSGTLGLAKAANARDLGGLVTASGRMVRRGLLYRAGALNRLNDEDVAALARLRLAHVVDFRHSEEIELDGADRLPPGCKVVSLPIFDPEHDAFTAISLALRAAKDGLGPEALAPSLGNTTAAMLDIYRWFVTGAAARQTYATVVRMVATAGSLPLLFHCSAGKDRTGWLAAVLLHALGVDRDTIVADYLRTNELNAPVVERALAKLNGWLPDPAAIRPLFEARVEYLHAAFDEAEAAYGGMDGYLRDGLAIDADTVAALRATLLE